MKPSLITTTLSVLGRVGPEGWAGRVGEGLEMVGRVKREFEVWIFGF